MPVLSNARYERFAQLVAQGRTMSDAYLEAGYKQNKGNPSGLKNKPVVAERISELLAERAKIVTRSASNEMEVTVETLLAELEKERELASAAGQFGPAITAIMGKARITGNIVDRREIGEAGAFDSKTDEELAAEAAKKTRELGFEPHIVEKKSGVG